MGFYPLSSDLTVLHAGTESPMQKVNAIIEEKGILLTLCPHHIFNLSLLAVP